MLSYVIAAVNCHRQPSLGLPKQAPAAVDTHLDADLPKNTRIIAASLTHCVVKIMRWDAASLLDSQKLDMVSIAQPDICLLYTSPSPRDGLLSRMPSSA